MNSRIFLASVMLVSEGLMAQVKISNKAFKADAKDYDKGTYAAIDLSVEPFAPALKKAEELAGATLKTRGEAHLTVLTPPEYMRLDSKIRKILLEDMKNVMQNGAELKPLCIGKGEAEVQGKKETAYFVVVDATPLRKVREKYHLQDFYPHVTLGFTKRDLHFEDGVKKDKSSCVAKLAATP
jgi:hypothetical protein